jgi:hypothetical protein
VPLASQDIQAVSGKSLLRAVARESARWRCLARPNLCEKKERQFCKENQKIRPTTTKQKPIQKRGLMRVQNPKLGF